jgi:hypothetical protein
VIRVVSGTVGVRALITTEKFRAKSNTAETGRADALKEWRSQEITCEKVVRFVRGKDR